MEYSNAQIMDVVFRNEMTGYSIIRLLLSGSHETITAVGFIPAAERGLTISVTGTWKNHAVYGKQLEVEKFSFGNPDSKEGIIFLLSSGIISNIGRKKAELIVEEFGLDTLAVIDRTPEKLLKVRGVGKKLLVHIINEWSKKKQLREIMSFFKEYGISLSTVRKIYKQFGDKVKEIVSKNPYILSEVVKGIGFVKADAIALKMGFFKNSEYRVRAGFRHILISGMEQGHCCLPRKELIERTVALLEVDVALIEASIDACIHNKSMIFEKELLWLPAIYYAEVGVAKKLQEMAGSSPDTIIEQQKLETWFCTYEKENSWKSDTLQKKALFELVKNQVMIVTGGPGTGKTTVLKVIVALFEFLHLPVLLAAPTGRAAQRISETTGRRASTIHRLLEYAAIDSSEEKPFKKNSDNPLDAALIIIDETSMIDIQLMCSLCIAVKKTTKLLLVGDSDQLPSVGPGNVLSDLIMSNSIPHVRLKTVFRQAEKSRIITAAHEINNGIVPDIHNARIENLFFIEEHDPEHALATIKALVTQRLPERYAFDPVRDIQVLSPMHRGHVGTERINTCLQSVLGNTGKVLKNRDIQFFMGDKVMQIKNNYELNIFNGDIGFVSDIINAESMTINFNGVFHCYSLDMIDQIIPAYCISIHKSQGSEFRAVIIPLMMEHFIMLQRNLIYTALTRAKELCVFIGEKRAFSIAVHNFKASVRYSLLAERVRTEVVQ